MNGEFLGMTIPCQHYFKAFLMCSQGWKLMMQYEFLLHNMKTSDSETLMHMWISWRACENKLLAPSGSWICVYGAELEDVHFRFRCCVCYWITPKSYFQMTLNLPCKVLITSHVDGRLYKWLRLQWTKNQSKPTFFKDILQIRKPKVTFARPIFLRHEASTLELFQWTSKAISAWGSWTFTEFQIIWLLWPL